MKTLIITLSLTTLTSCVADQTKANISTRYSVRENQYESHKTITFDRLGGGRYFYTIISLKSSNHKYCVKSINTPEQIVVPLEYCQALIQYNIKPEAADFTKQ